MPINKRTLLLGALAASAGARAQSGPWKSKTSRILVGGPASGGIDGYARLFAEHLGRALGGSFIVENKPGASGTVAALTMVQSPADGSTMLVGSNSQFVINPLLNPSHGYSMRDLVPVGSFASYPSLLIARTGLPFNTVQGLVAYGRGNPGKLVFGNTGMGTIGHLGHELLCEQAGLQSLLVNYLANSQLLLAIGRGDVDYAFVNYSDARYLLDAGKAMALGVSTARRNERFPNIPAIAEAGYREVDFRIWLGYMMRTGVPEATRLEVARQLAPFVSRPDMKARLDEAGQDAMVESSDAMRQRMAAESQRWERLIKARDIQGR